MVRSVASASSEGSGGGTAARFFTALFDNMVQGFSAYNADLRLVLFNRRYAELLEYPPGFLKTGIAYEDVMRFNLKRGEYGPVKDQEAFVRERLASLRTPERWIRHEHVRPNGMILGVQRIAVPEGGFINSYYDITQRKRAEQEVNRNAAILQATIDNMADGIRVFDKDLRLLAWNKKAFEMLDFPESLASKGTPYGAFLEYCLRRGDYGPNPGSETLDRKIERARHPSFRENVQQLPNGRIILKRTNPMPEGGFVSTYFDITEHKRNEQELARQATELARGMEERKAAHVQLLEAKERAEVANRAKSEFLANMSHELRTPLNAIIGFSQLMESETMGPLGHDRYRGYARDIKNSGVHLLQIIGNILELSRVEAGKYQIEESVVDLLRLIERSIARISSQAKSASLAIESDIPRDLPSLRADVSKLEQVMLNLLSNAVKFTPAGGRVTIAARNDRGGIAIRVSDTGIGIAPADIPKALAPFSQIDNSLSRRFSGIGLGLPLADSFVRLHGGTLTLESAAGRGTTVTVSLPASRIVSTPA